LGCWPGLTRWSKTKIAVATTWHFEIVSKNKGLHRNGSDVPGAIHGLLCALSSAGRDRGAERVEAVTLAFCSIQSPWGPDERKTMPLHQLLHCVGLQATMSGSGPHATSHCWVAWNSSFPRQAPRVLTFRKKGWAQRVSQTHSGSQVPGSTRTT